MHRPLTIARNSACRRLMARTRTNVTERCQVEPELPGYASGVVGGFTAGSEIIKNKPLSQTQKTCQKGKGTINKQ